MQAWLTTISLAICKVGFLLGFLVLNVFCPVRGFSFFVLISLCFMWQFQAVDLLEMLKKEEEILSAIKEKQSKVFLRLMIVTYCAISHDLMSSVFHSNTGNI